MQSDLALQATATLAALPILTIMVLILGFKTSAAIAGWAGLAVALVVAWTGFGFGTTLHAEAGPVAVAAGAMVKAVFVAATILCRPELANRRAAGA